MATDFTKLPPQILVDLINLTDNISLAVTDILIGPVSKIVGGNRNSAITITAVPGSGYYGSRDLTYDRVNFAQVPGIRSILFRSETAIFVADLIPLINAAYRLNLQPEDYLNSVLPEISSASDSFRVFSLVAKPESLIWTGSVELNLEGLKQNLSSVLTTAALSGFEYTLDQLIDATILSGFEFPFDQLLNGLILSGFDYPVELRLTGF